MRKRERVSPAYRDRRHERSQRDAAQQRIVLARTLGPALMEALHLTALPRVLSLQLECVAGKVATVVIKQAVSERQAEGLAEMLRERRFSLVPFNEAAKPPPIPEEPEPFAVSESDVVLVDSRQSPPDPQWLARLARVPAPAEGEARSGGIGEPDSAAGLGALDRTTG